MGRLLLLFIIVPAVELLLLIEIGERIGGLATVGLIVITGLVGASLARQQGLRTLGQLQTDLEAGRPPTTSLVDGLLILVAGALLVTPGVLTDVFGFLCLTPVSRQLMRNALMRSFERGIESGNVSFRMNFNQTFGGNFQDHGSGESFRDHRGGESFRDHGGGEIYDMPTEDDPERSSDDDS